MRINPRTIIKVAQALTDPHPEFVSFVPHGANQKPIQVLKSANPPEGNSMTKRSTVAKDNAFKGSFLASKSGEAHPPVAEIASLSFKLGQFADSAAVKAWLDSRNYEGYEIVTVKDAKEGETGFTVAGLPAESFEGDLSDLEMVDGVTAKVGRTKKAAAEPTAAEKAAVEEKAAKDAADKIVAVKEARDWLEANVSDAKTALAGKSDDDLLKLAHVGKAMVAKDAKNSGMPLASIKEDAPAAETDEQKAEREATEKAAAEKATKDAAEAAKTAAGGQTGATDGGATPPAETAKTATDVRVITVKSDKDRPAVEAVVKSMRELANKYSSWAAQCSGDKGLAEVMSEGADGLPPGIYEVNDAFYQALRNCIIGKDMGAVRSLCLEFGDMVVEMATVFSAATIPAEEVMASAFAVSKDAAKPVTKTMKSAVVGFDPAALTEIVKAAMAPALEQVSKLSETVKANHETTTKAIDTVTKEVGDRVAVLEGARQTRKSGDGTPVSTETTKKTETQKGGADDRLTRGLFGISQSGPRVR